MTTADKIRALEPPLETSDDTFDNGWFGALEAAAAALVEAEPPQAVRVKPLVWENYDAFTHWSYSLVGTYRVEERNGVWRASLHQKNGDFLIYEYTSDGLTPDDFEAAKIAAQADCEARILAAIELTPPAVADSPAPDPVSNEQMYLIRKRGYFYRPNCCGYTSSVADAGRYTLAQAERETHPNGKNGPRDGMDYIPAPDPVSPTLDALAMKRAAIDQMGQMFRAGVSPEKWPDYIAAITLPTDAALAEAMELPEVKAMVAVLKKLRGGVRFVTNAEIDDALKGASHE